MESSIGRSTPSPARLGINKSDALIEGEVQPGSTAFDGLTFVLRKGAGVDVRAFGALSTVRRFYVPIGKRRSANTWRLL
jgi:hypothetical protein